MEICYVFFLFFPWCPLVISSKFMFFGCRLKILYHIRIYLVSVTINSFLYDIKLKVSKRYGHNKLNRGAKKNYY